MKNLEKKNKRSLPPVSSDWEEGGKTGRAAITFVGPIFGGGGGGGSLRLLA